MENYKNFEIYFLFMPFMLRHPHMLVKADYLSGVGDVAVGQLGHVHKAVLMDTNIDKGAEVGDVGHDAWQFHTFVQVVNGLHARVELELLNLLAGVAPRFLQLAHDIGEGRESDFAGNIATLTVQ